MRTKEQMYEDIRNWEMEAGEDFLDYFGSELNEFNFMFWCHGRGYISKEQLQAFEKTSGCHGTEFLYGDEEYSVVKEGEDLLETGLEKLEKAYRILADFLSLTSTYQRRVDLFLRNITPLKYVDVITELCKNEKVFYELDGETVYIDKETEISPQVIIKAKWYRDNN